MEESFGISEYVALDDKTPIPCLLKEMYSDFTVQEVLADGSVLPFQSSSDINSTIQEEKDQENDDSVEPPSFINEEILKELDERSKEPGKPVVIPVKGLEKEDRKNVHVFIRTRYTGKLISEMKEKDGETNIVVNYGLAGKNLKRKRWDENTPSEVHFTMAKENKETAYALGIVSRFLNVPSSALKTHGIKDKRAVTTQRVSVRRIHKQQILSINSKLRDILVYDVVYTTEGIKMGGHWGNRFSIVLRNIDQSHKGILSKRLSTFEKDGFVNYFGTQRFGSFGNGTGTADVGRLILQRQWQKAVTAILKSCVSDSNVKSHSSYHAVKCFEETGNARWALKKLRGAQGFATIEGMILKCLSSGGTYQKAIVDALPIHQRSLYVHAYQSLLWNHAASRRIQEGGNKVQPTDTNANGEVLNESSSVFDIYLPLPGENEKFKEHYASRWYEEIMTRDEITNDSFNSLKDRFSLGEASRRLFEEPKNVEYEFISYSDPRCLLQDGLVKKAIPQEERTGDLLALRVSFSLRSGCYATVALRQITAFDMGKNSMKAISETQRTERIKIEEEEKKSQDVELPVVAEETKEVAA